MGMDGIAAASMAMSQARLEQAVSVSVAKKAMDGQEQQAEALLEMLPPTEHIVDVYA